MGRILLNDIRRSFGGTEVIHGVTLEVRMASSSSSSAPPVAGSRPSCG